MKEKEKILKLWVMGQLTTKMKNIQIFFKRLVLSMMGSKDADPILQPTLLGGMRGRDIFAGQLS